MRLPGFVHQIWILIINIKQLIAPFIGTKENANIRIMPVKTAIKILNNEGKTTMMELFYASSFEVFSIKYKSRGLKYRLLR